MTASPDQAAEREAFVKYRGRPAPSRHYPNVNRYWDPTRDRLVAKLLPGEFYVAREGELIATVLGSCVSACVRDPEAGFGGMNHFMLPHSDKPGSWGGAGNAARYGTYAMETLINDILKAGGRRDRLEVKAFGGGKILTKLTDIGQQNIRFLLEFLRFEGLQLKSHDLGDVYPRKVIYYPDSGNVQIKKLRTMHNKTIVEREKTYLHELDEKPQAGDVELF
jgi:chemotaxis protein CheD